MDLAEEILFDLKSLLKNDGRPGCSGLKIEVFKKNANDKKWVPKMIFFNGNSF